MAVLPGEQAGLDLAHRALLRRPSAVFADVDGTISPIVEVPQNAVVLPRCRAALQELSRRIDLVCLLSGRPADETWRMVRVDGAVYVGNHGVETWLHGELLRPPGVERYHARLARASATLRVVLANVPGLVFEDKGIGFAIHYRREPSAGDAVIEAARRVAGGRGLQVRVQSAHVEVRAPVQGDKGTALASLAERYGLRGLIVVGDDAVDVPAFAAARVHADAHDALAVRVSVGPFLESGDIALADPAAVGEFLSALVAALA
jgi:trehalose 6-phosphate phosphatase